MTMKYPERGLKLRFSPIFTRAEYNYTLSMRVVPNKP